MEAMQTPSEVLACPKGLLAQRHFFGFLLQHQAPKKSKTQNNKTSPRRNDVSLAHLHISGCRLQAFGTHTQVLCAVFLLILHIWFILVHIPVNTNVLIYFASGHHELPPEPIPCLEDLKLFAGKLSSPRWVEGLASAALVSSVPGPSPPSTVLFPSGRALSFLISPCSWETSWLYCGYSHLEEKAMPDGSGIVYRPFCVSPSVMLALSTILTHRSLQPPPALILLGVWFKAHKICSYHAWSLRQDQRWTQTMQHMLIQFLGDLKPLQETHLLSGCWNVGILLCKKSTSLPLGLLLLN